MERRKGKRALRTERWMRVWTQKQGEVIAVGESLGLDAGLEVGVEAAHGRQVQAAQQGVEIQGKHQATPSARKSRTWTAP
jgi:hypothetical protein